jgi:hypothetical protein
MMNEAEFARLIKKASSPADQSRKRSGKQSTHSRKSGRYGSRRNRPAWAVELRRMLEALPKFEITGKATYPFSALCEPAIKYAWSRFAAQGDKLLYQAGNSVRHSLTDELRTRLLDVAEPCFQLRLQAYRAIYGTLFVSSENLQTVKTTSLLDRFSAGQGVARLTETFQAFPVLARVWSQLITDWRIRTAELLERIRVDRGRVGRTFFGVPNPGKLIRLRTGLSDPHHGGRTVLLLEFEAGRVVYKPRSGAGERQWFGLLRWMNTHGFKPAFQIVKVIDRSDYCWMEYVPGRPCRTTRDFGRFYQRAGAMLCAAHLLRAVDCHRGNVIVCGEHPVLVDAEALLHFEGGDHGENSVDSLFQTGFLPLPRQRQNGEYSVPAISPALPRPRLRGSRPFDYQRAVIAGFRAGWRTLLGNSRRRAAVQRRLRRLTNRKWRRIHLPSMTYFNARQAGMQPAALTSGIARSVLLGALCQRANADDSILRAEVAALNRLDIPSFAESVRLALLPGEETLDPKLDRIHRALVTSSDRRVRSEDR